MTEATAPTSIELLAMYSAQQRQIRKLRLQIINLYLVNNPERYSLVSNLILRVSQMVKDHPHLTEIEDRLDDIEAILDIDC